MGIHASNTSTATFVASLSHDRTYPNVPTRVGLRREAARPIELADAGSLNSHKLVRSFGPVRQNRIVWLIWSSGPSQAAITPDPHTRECPT